MDPLSVGLLLAGTGASIGGGILGRNDALANAQRAAEARNAVLAANIAKQQGFYDTNKGTFDANMSNYAQPAQAQQLQTAQDTRSAANTGNMTQVDPNSILTQADGSPAVKSEIVKRMLGTFNMATDRAKSMGKLGGYGDSWLQNQFGNLQADRDIGVTNSFAEGRKALLGPEQDAASAAAYQPPSIWGSLLSGAGSIASAFGGSRMGRRPTWDPSNTFLQQQPTDI
jgi:hypothetical protein